MKYYICISPTNLQNKQNRIKTQSSIKSGRGEWVYDTSDYESCLQSNNVSQMWEKKSLKVRLLCGHKVERRILEEVTLNCVFFLWVYILNLLLCWESHARWTLYCGINFGDTKFSKTLSRKMNIHAGKNECHLQCTCLPEGLKLGYQLGIRTSSGESQAPS